MRADKRLSREEALFQILGFTGSEIIPDSEAVWRLRARFTA
jgi:hypothetical protein